MREALRLCLSKGQTHVLPLYGFGPPLLSFDFFMHYVSNKVVQGLLGLKVQEEPCSTITTTTAPLLPTANFLSEGILLGMLRTPAEKRLKRNPGRNQLRNSFSTSLENSEIKPV